MPRVNFVKAARKDNSLVKKGESYYWWKFRYGGKHMSLKPPRPSQLTQSSFLSTVYAALESLEDLTADMDADDLKSAVEEAAGEIRSAGEEALSNRDNMPEALQDGETGNMLQERADAAEQLADELEAVDLDVEDFDEPEREEGESDEAFEERKEAAEKEHEEAVERAKQDYLEEVQAMSYDGE